MLMKFKCAEYNIHRRPDITHFMAAINSDRVIMKTKLCRDEGLGGMNKCYGSTQNEPI